MLKTTLFVSKQTKQEQIQTLLKKLENEVGWQNPSTSDADLTIINEENDGIKIATVRKLITDANFKPYTRSQRAVFILNLEQASLPAQQALLKYLEEPPEYLLIAATTTHLQAILPTIQSRCAIEYDRENRQIDVSKEVHSLIENLATTSIGDSIDISAQYKDREQAILFLQQCLIAIKNSTHFPNKSLVAASQSILTALDHLHRNANTRLTIEHCFFTIKNRF